ncbi:hypothetical protein [Kitasatospora paracochleata]|uniref:Spore-associated protein A n=1 Tax=Kitasatospora paracochleata TaxID=58354 RepID=A0ABT1J451_9ACTN|nr:hypothetical protein [Kitasatospora paracochleata]MCP2311851.1 hypothetical protein [Kitasatospora paracochleata]
MKIRKAMAGLLVAGLAAVGTAATAPAAHADGYGCAGSLVWSHTMTAGTVYTYFDGTNNCSVFVKSTYYGTPTTVELQIENNAGQWGNLDNHGPYKYYAGPSRVYGVGHCVREFIYAENPSGGAIENDYTDWHSCN